MLVEILSELAFASELAFDLKSKMIQSNCSKSIFENWIFRQLFLLIYSWVFYEKTKFLKRRPASIGIFSLNQYKIIQYLYEKSLIMLKKYGTLVMKRICKVERRRFESLFVQYFTSIKNVKTCPEKTYIE